MTVAELRKLLQEAEEDGLGDKELRFAYQPNYPLQDKVDGIAVLDEDADDITEIEFVYLVTAGQDRNRPYAPRNVFECVRTA